MNHPTGTDPIRLALAHHAAGRLREAESGYRQVLSHNPNHAEATHLLGVIRHQTGASAEAIRLIRRAIELASAGAGSAPATYFNNLAEALRASGAMADAIEAYRRALELRPNYPDALINLGLATQSLGDAAGAVRHFARALEFAPTNPTAAFHLGVALRLAGHFREAAQVLHKLANAHPQFAHAAFELGVTLKDLGELDLAIECWERAATLGYDPAVVTLNLGTARLDQARFGDAIPLLRRAIELNPAAPAPRMNLAKALGDQGKLDEAADAYRGAMRAAPTDPLPHSHLLFLLNHHPGLSGEQLYAAHREWAERYAAHLTRQVHTRPADSDPRDRRLRIGYVSADFRENHPVGFFVEPILAGHDRGRFFVKCYSDVRRPDGVTERLRASVDAWDDTAGLSDPELAARVRDDAIDLLVDLSVHAGQSRLLAFALKPAPVQLTYLGYPNTTGLDAIDYRITDRHMDPVGMTERYHSERLARLADTYFCYTPPAGAPPVTPPPSTQAGHVTFGSFNRLIKLSDPALELWSAVLRETPDSRLLLKAPGLWDEETRQYTVSRFTHHGIDAGRITMEGFTGFAEFLTAHERIDIALDPLPFNGGTTTLHGLWMGVPAITLAGQTPVSRIGASLLGNLNLNELIAASAEDYVAIAANLARDPHRLAALRSVMRQRMAQSPLMDVTRFVRELERIYATIWARWCDDDQRVEPSPVSIE